MAAKASRIALEAGVASCKGEARSPGVQRSAGAQSDHNSPRSANETQLLSQRSVSSIADVDQLQRITQPVRNQLIGLTGLGDAGRMVVHLMCPALFCALAPGSIDIQTYFLSGRHITRPYGSRFTSCATQRGDCHVGALLRSIGDCDRFRAMWLGPAFDRYTSGLRAARQARAQH